MTETSTDLHCQCGAFHLTVIGKPMVSSECHCQSCRDAAARLATLPTPGPPATALGGTHYVLYRKDRVQFPDGTTGLQWFRLGPERSTKRVLAPCCNTPVFLEFKGGHWLSLYAQLWPQGAVPPSELHTMTKDMPPSAKLPSGASAGAWPTARFYAKLLGAWIAMGFRVPAIPLGREIQL